MKLLNSKKNSYLFLFLILICSCNYKPLFDKDQLGKFTVKNIETNLSNQIETGTVVKIQGDKVLWKTNKSGAYLIGDINKLEKIENG